MAGKANAIFVTSDEALLDQISDAESMLEHTIIHCAKSEAEVAALISSWPQAPVFLSDTSAGGEVWAISRALVERFPDVSISILANGSRSGKDIEDIGSNIVMMVPKPAAGRELAALVGEGLRLAQRRWRDARERRALEKDKVSIEEAVGAFMRSQQDLASLVHCGQELQECLDREEACQKIVSALKELGLDTTIVFEDNREAQHEIRSLSLSIATHFQTDGDSARLYFAQGSYAGYINARADDGYVFDKERFSDVLHLFKNQLIAFLDRLCRAEEREKLLIGYKSILSRLEEIVTTSDFCRKTKNVREGLESEAEGMFDVLDKIRAQVPQEVIPWVSEAEMRLQFADRVAQQINHLAGVLRDLIRVLNPELVSAVDVDEGANNKNICETDQAKQDDVDSLLSSLGL